MPELYTTGDADILSTTPEVCSGLGVAFVSGHIAGSNAANYLDDL